MGLQPCQGINSYIPTDEHGRCESHIPSIYFISHPCPCSIFDWLLLSVLLGAADAHGPDSTRRHLFSILHLAHACSFFSVRVQNFNPNSSATSKFQTHGLQQPLLMWTVRAPVSYLRFLEYPNLDAAGICILTARVFTRTLLEAEDSRSFA